MAYLQRKLGLIDIFCIASGAMVSSGLFVLPGLAHAQAGHAVLFSYFFAGLLASSGMLSVAEIITAMPKAGGDYFFITRAMGPAAGTVAGLLSWFSPTLKSAFALVGIYVFLIPLVNWDPFAVTIAICVSFMIINISGVKTASKLQGCLVLGLLGLMVLYIAFGVRTVEIQNFVPFVPYGWTAVFSTAGFVFVSYGGLLNVAAVAEEVKDPGKVIPRGMILSLITIIVFYTLMVFVTSGLLGANELHRSQRPISDGALVLLGPVGEIVMSVAAILAFISTANAGIMSASRYLLSLSRDELIPSFFGRVNIRFKTPHVAILITGLLMIASLFLQLEILVKAASTVVILTCILSNLSVIILRESRLWNYQPKFRAPLYPWIQIGGIGGYALLLPEMGTEALAASALLILGGLFFYWFYGRIRTEREYALLHLVERFSDRELVRGVLESELREIIRERDELCIDRFDLIVEQALVLDVEDDLEAEKFFALLGQELCGKLDQDPETIQQKLSGRQAAGSCVIVPGVAVSDIIVRGEKYFDVVLVRCRSGILFPGEESKVHAFFLLITTKDERNFYLRAVTAIAQIVQDPSFEKRWGEAKTVDGLRDFFLLGARRRLCLSVEQSLEIGEKKLEVGNRFAKSFLTFPKT